jgi:hypothetical protein
MGKCNIDHSLEDVKNKLEEQSAFLPENVKVQVEESLTNEKSQAFLNELFHLLKKYDLADQREKEDRNTKIINLIKE